MLWTIKSVLQWMQQFFTGKGIPNSRVDAELLLAEVLHCNRIKLYIDQDRPLSKDELGALHNLVARRAGREPMAYILGSKGFMQDEFQVTPAVLIPRPETELLVEHVAKLAGQGSVRILDIGTGSGAIALSLARLLPQAAITAADVSLDALEIARKNSVNFGLDGRVEFLVSDVYGSLAGREFDIIVSNPPYIPTGDLTGLQPEVQQEPSIALDGGADGLDFYRRIIGGAANFLTSGGLLAFEIGSGQGAQVAELCRVQGFGATRIVKDYSGLERMVFGAAEGGDFGDKILAAEQW